MSFFSQESNQHNTINNYPKQKEEYIAYINSQKNNSTNNSTTNQTLLRDRVR